MTPAQCRAARALIEMSLNDLAAKAVVPPMAIWDLEAAFAAPNEADINAMKTVLENAGVEFIADVGVKLKVRGQKGPAMSEPGQVLMGKTHPDVAGQDIASIEW
jgi:hypothetical protein